MTIELFVLRAAAFDGVRVAGRAAASRGLDRKDGEIGRVPEDVFGR